MSCIERCPLFWGGGVAYRGVPLYIQKNQETETYLCSNMDI